MKQTTRPAVFKWQQTVPEFILCRALISALLAFFPELGNSPQPLEENEFF